MPNPQGRNLLAPPETLNIQGRGLSPLPNFDSTMLSMTSSLRSSLSDQDDASQHSDQDEDEDYTVLDGVRDMNHMLVKQIETLRLKIRVDEKNSQEDKLKLRSETDKTLVKKETEIEDLKDSLFDRDERIHGLIKAGNEKDKQIKSKSQEIESLKELMKQSDAVAQKLQKQMNRVISDKARLLEDDPLYRKQNEEMVTLTAELVTLRERLASMDEELQRAMEVIGMQDEKMKAIMEEKNLIHAKFREELDRVSKAMRQEVERMREVMRQNYEEMRNLREENKQMHNDVRDIKEMLRATRMSNQNQNTNQYECETITGLQRPISSNASNLHARNSSGISKAVPPKGPGAMIGGNIAQKPSTRFHRNNNMALEDSEESKRLRGGGGRDGTKTPSLQIGSRSRSNISGSNNYETQKHNNNNTANSSSYVRSSLDSYRSHLSPDRSSKPLDKRVVSGQYYVAASTASQRYRSYPPNIPEQHDKEDHKDDAKNFLPICSLKDGTSASVKRPFSRPSKSAIRKGSSVRKS